MTQCKFIVFLVSLILTCTQNTHITLEDTSSSFWDREEISDVPTSTYYDPASHRFMTQQEMYVYGPRETKIVTKDAKWRRQISPDVSAYVEEETGFLEQRSHQKDDLLHDVPILTTTARLPTTTSIQLPTTTRVRLLSTRLSRKNYIEQALMDGSLRRQLPPSSNRVDPDTVNLSLFATRTHAETVITKCFVCGLNETGVPYNSDCSFSFDNKHLPKLPIDPYLQRRAQTPKKEFIRFCHQVKLESGRMAGFTGGCVLRWVEFWKIDKPHLGKYTQRACRNNLRPHQGKSFVSRLYTTLESQLKEKRGFACKKMAEKQQIPLNYNVTLYATPHVCVCDGDFCNGAPPLVSPAHPAALILTSSLLCFFQIFS